MASVYPRRGGSKLFVGASNSEAKRKYILRENAFSSVTDEQTAYWLGFLFADGCVFARRNDAEKGLRVVLQSQDAEHLRSLAAFLETNAPLRNENSNTAFGLHAYSHKIVDDLIALGCIPDKSNALVLKPPKLNPDLFVHFVRGYFDGDGSAYATGGSPTINFCGNATFLTVIYS